MNLMVSNIKGKRTTSCLQNNSTLTFIIINNVKYYVIEVEVASELNTIPLLSSRHILNKYADVSLGKIVTATRVVTATGSICFNKTNDPVCIHIITLYKLITFRDLCDCPAKCTLFVNSELTIVASNHRIRKLYTFFFQHIKSVCSRNACFMIKFLSIGIFCFVIRAICVPYNLSKIV